MNNVDYGWIKISLDLACLSAGSTRTPGTTACAQTGPSNLWQLPVDPLRMVLLPGVGPLAGTDTLGSLKNLFLAPLPVRRWAPSCIDDLLITGG